MTDTVVDWKTREPRDVIPGFHGRFAHSERMSFAYWDIDAGATLPEHEHEHEQVINVLEGRFEVTMNGRTEVLEAGSLAVVPSGVRHSGRALTFCRILDVFAPVREDYRAGSTGSVLQSAMSNG